MANVYSSKLKKLLFDPQASLGVPETIDANSILLPAYDISLERNRGTRMISRQGVMDGRAGAMKSCPGSWGSTLTFSCEIMDIDGVDDPYWVQLLYACGHEGDATSPSNVIIPSNKAVVGYTAGSPCAGTFAIAQDVNDHTADYLLPVFDATGTMELALVAGERASLNLTFVARNDDGFIDLSNTDTEAFGTFPSTSCPFIVKNITASMTDLETTDVLEVINLSSLVLTSNAVTPDVLDPTTVDGFGLSPVFFNDAPSVAFTLGATSTNNDFFWQYFRNGYGISISATLTSAATGNTINISIPFVQFTELAFGNQDGIETYVVQAQAVRNANSSTSPYTITWTYA